LARGANPVLLNAKQSFDVPAAAEHTENRNILAVNAVDGCECRGTDPRRGRGPDAGGARRKNRPEIESICQPATPMLPLRVDM